MARFFHNLKLDGAEAVVQRVTTSAGATGWCKAAFEKLIAGGVCSFDELCYYLSDREISLSTAYSGIMSAETAFKVITNTAAEFMAQHGLTNQPIIIKNEWACENNGPCQDELMNHPDRATCIFDDVASLGPEVLQDMIKAAKLHKSEINVEQVRHMLQTFVCLALHV